MKPDHLYQLDELDKFDELYKLKSYLCTPKFKNYEGI